MKVSELCELIKAENLTPALEEDREITCGYACDLLSWVMAHGDEGMAVLTSPLTAYEICGRMMAHGVAAHS